MRFLICFALCSAIVFAADLPFEFKGRSLRFPLLKYAVTLPAGDWQVQQAETYDALANRKDETNVGVASCNRVSPRAYMIGFYMGVTRGGVNPFKEVSRKVLPFKDGEALEVELQMDTTRQYLRITTGPQKTISVLCNCQASQYARLLPEFRACADSLALEPELAKPTDFTHPSVSSVGSTITTTDGFKLVLPSPRWKLAAINGGDLVLASTDGTVVRARLFQKAMEPQAAAQGATTGFLDRAQWKQPATISSKAVKIGNRDGYRMVIEGPQTAKGAQRLVATGWRDGNRTFAVGAIYEQVIESFAAPDVDQLIASFETVGSADH